MTKLTFEEKIIRKIDRIQKGRYYLIGDYGDKIVRKAIRLTKLELEKTK